MHSKSQELITALESVKDADFGLDKELALNIVSCMDDYIREQWPIISKELMKIKTTQVQALTNDFCNKVMRFRAEDMIFSNF